MTNHVNQILNQVRSAVRRLGIHPLLLILAAVFCLFFPRFFVLAALGYGIWWVAKNIWFTPGGHGPRKGGRRR